MPKLTLDRTYMYAGATYGPGEVEIDNADAVKAIQAKLPKQEQASTKLDELDGAALLIEAGYDTPEKIRAASDAELLAINGVGEKTLARIRAALGA